VLTILKAYGGWMALVAALGLALGLYRSEIRAAEARGEAELMAAEVEAGWTALLDSVDVWDARKATADSAIQALRSDLDRQSGLVRVARESASTAILSARATIAALSDSLGQLTQADLDAISAAIDSSEEATRLCTGALGSCEQLVKAADARIFQIEAEQRQSLDLNRSQALVIDRLTNLRKPSIGAVGWLGYALATVLGTLLVIR